MLLGQEAPSPEDSLKTLSENIKELTMAIVNLFPAAQGTDPNAASFKVLTTTVTTFGTPQQLTALAIPNGKMLSITADRANTGLLFVADSSANALLATARLELKAGESTSLLVTNRSAVWIDSSIARSEEHTSELQS